MDIFSTSQLHDYEEILEQINSEHGKADKLRKLIEVENDKILIYKLSVSQSKPKLSHVNVKVFNTISEIYYLYDNELDYHELESLSKNNESCKFYLIEIYLPEELLIKLASAKWKLQITVCSSDFNISKTCPLLSDKNTMYHVLPVHAYIQECLVKSCLFLPSENGWNTIELDSVNVDISYHFEALKNKKNVNENNLTNKLIKISKLYSDNHQNIDLMTKDYKLKTEILCNFTKENDFISNFVRNSYHRLDLEIFAEFPDDNISVIEFQFLLLGEKVAISYNKVTNHVRMKCSSKSIPSLKKFFWKHSSLFTNCKKIQHKSKVCKVIFLCLFLSFLNIRKF